MKTYARKTMNRKLKYGSLSIVAASVLYACGGGGGGGDEGVSESFSDVAGTGVSANGVITGFGSVFVNGIRFDTDNAVIIIDDMPASESDLALGMVVRADGMFNAPNDNGSRSGNASRISFDSLIEGPVSVSPVANVDDTVRTFSVLGIMVAIDERSTVFRRGVTYADVAMTDRLIISGFFDANGVLRATYVSRDDDTFVPNVSEVEAHGIIENFSGSSFDLRLASGASIAVNVNGSTELDGLPNDMIADGLTVEVEGTIAALDATTINAREIEDESFDDDFDGFNFSINGSVNNYVSNAEFNVANQRVDASGARFSPRRLGENLANGAVIQVEGRRVNGVLMAERIDQRRGSVEIESRVQAVDPANNVITMMLPNSQSIDVNVNFSTQFEDEDGDDDGNRSRFNISDIRTGDFLEVEGYLVGGNVFASEIEREDDDDDDIEIQAPIQSFDTTARSVTLLGVTFTIDGETEFEDDDDADISASEFFSRLAIGNIVEINDEDPADGIADEVEFEDDDFGFSFNDFEDEDEDDDDDGIT